MLHTRSKLLIAWFVACTPQAPSSEARPHDRVAPAPVAIAAATSESTPAPTQRLQRWMESELLYRIRVRDFRGLERALDALATVAPPAYARWAEVAQHASQAAKDHDVDAVRKGCAACHQQYRARYRAASIDLDIDRLIERSRK
jgi:hypothetical protein